MRAKLPADGEILAMKPDAFARQHPVALGPLLGTWKLQTFTTTYQESGERLEPYGARPHGRLHYGTDGRMYAIIAHATRKLPVALVLTAAERLEQFDGFAAYAGRYSIDGDRVSHHVDISWNEAWTGTTQVRRFKIEGNLLHIRSFPEPDFLDGLVTSSELTWIRPE
jgi:hypothetical protein